MQLLIAGGTGFIGQSLITLLTAHGHQVTVISRDPTKVKQLFSDPVKSIAWQELTVNQIKHFDAIINLAGANIGESRWSSQKRKEIMDSRVETTRALASLCAKLGIKSPSLLNASAIGIYDFSEATEPRGHFYCEDSFINFNEAPNFLADIARRWELATRIASDQAVRVVNLRFGIVLSTRGGALKKLLLSFQMGLGAKIGSGRQAFTWVALRDVINAIEFILQTPSISGPVNIVSPNPVSQEEFADSLAKFLHRPRLLTMPSQVVQLLFGQMGEELLLNGAWVKPEKLLNHGFIFQLPNLLQAFGSEI